MIVLDQFYDMVLGNVSHCQVQVFTHGQREVVGGLVGIDDVNTVFQSFLGRFGIVEREVHVVGEVAEDILKMCFESTGDTGSSARWSYW